MTQEKIAKVVGLDRSAVSRIVQNTKISEMHNLLCQGRDMDYIARHYHMDRPLAHLPCRITFASSESIWMTKITD